MVFEDFTLINELFHNLFSRATTALKGIQEFSPLGPVTDWKANARRNRPTHSRNRSR